MFQNHLWTEQIEVGKVVALSHTNVAVKWVWYLIKCYACFGSLVHIEYYFHKSTIYIVCAAAKPAAAGGRRRDNLGHKSAAAVAAAAAGHLAYLKIWPQQWTVAAQGKQIASDILNAVLFGQNKRWRKREIGQYKLLT